MGVLAIDSIGARLDGLFTVASGYYNRRMSPPDLPKAVPGTWETRTVQVDPLLGMQSFGGSDQ